MEEKKPFDFTKVYYKIELYFVDEDIVDMQLVWFNYVEGEVEGELEEVRRDG